MTLGCTGVRLVDPKMQVVHAVPEYAHTVAQPVMAASLTALGTAYTCETDGKVVTLIDNERVASLTRCSE